MPGVSELIGGKVLKEGDETVDTASFEEEGKVLGLYFSAHWCPPCRGFTPKLAEWYNNFKLGDKGKLLEIVFVSSDKDQDVFDEYFKEMPWHSLPFSERDLKAKLSKKFKVQGIPSLVFVEGSTGKLITDDGRNCVVDDPEGKNFPWYPKALDDMLCGTLKSKDGDVDCCDALKNKVTGIYFSAHWCPPCRGFTPDLVKAYNTIRADGKNFEMIFASSDRSEDSFNEYYAEMPWLSIPFGDARKNELSKYFGVEGIPTLVILDENRQVITNNGRGAVQEDPEGKDFPWHPKPLQELKGSNASCLNESACLLYFTDAEVGPVETAKGLLQGVAEKYMADYKACKDTDSEIPELHFLYEGEKTEELADSIRSFANLSDRVPMVVLMDLPEQCQYTLPEGDINADVIAKLVDDFKNNKLESKSLKG